MKESSELGLLLKAATFSAIRHRDQRRKGVDASPYINHPLDVAHILANVAGVTDVEILVAAVLHDTIEDTRTSAEEIETAFGRKVRVLVEEVTDDKSLPKPDRKRLQIEHAPHLSPGAKLIKIADKISNILDVVKQPPVDWPLARRREYLDWTKQVVQGCRGLNKALEDHYDDVLRDGLRALSR